MGMKKIDYSDLGLEPHEIKILCKELEILSSEAETYLDHRAENDYTPTAALDFLTKAGWTDVKPNRRFIIRAIHNAFPYFSPHKIYQLFHKIDNRFKEAEGIFTEVKMFRKKPSKEQFYFSDTPAQGKQQIVVWPDGRAFESITQAGEILGKELGISRYTLARRLRNGSL